MKKPLFLMILLMGLTPSALLAQDKVRIYVTDSDSWFDFWWVRFGR